jgi:hypothetical protein
MQPGERLGVWSAPGSTKDAGDILENERIPLSHIPLGRRVEIDEVVNGVLFSYQINQEA